MRQFSARRLRERRQSAGLTREQVAVAAHLSASSVDAYEQGSTVPGVDAAARLADVLGVTVDDLLEAPEPVGVAA